jgi:hypothetical protein
MGVINGTPVNATNTNSAFLNKNQADQMTFPVSFASTASLSKRDESSAATLNALATSTSLVRVTGTVTTINGAAAPSTYSDGQLLIISNASGSSVTINHESGSATASNRFSLPSSIALTVQAGQAVSFFYDTTSARWRPSAGAGSGGGVSAWASSFAYVAGNVVIYNASGFICLASNTSGSSFEADYALGYWRQINRPTVSRNIMEVGQSFESGTVSGWQLFSTTLTGVIPTGSLTLGTAASLSLGVVSSGQIAGTYSIAAGNTASNNIAAGQGIISQVYNIDQIDQAKALSIRMAYKANANLSTALMNFSGTSSNTWAVYIYDVTNSAWIQPAGVYNLVQSSGVGIHSGTWQTPSNMTQFRLAILCVNATTGTTPAANAYQMYFDEFYVGSQPTAIAPAISDWQTYTPTISNLGTGTTASSYGKYRRVGDSIEIEFRWQKDASAGTGSGNVTLSLPSGLTIDSTKLPNSSSVIAGSLYYSGGGTTFFPAADSTGIIFFNQTSAAQVTGAQVAANSAWVGFVTNVPIVGWSSNSVSSADTDTRVVAAYVTGTTTSVGASTTITPTTIVKDTHGAWSGSTYTVPVSGYYSLSAILQAGSNTATYYEIYYKQNATSVLLGGNRVPSATANLYAGGSAVIYCNTGDTIVFVGNNQGTAQAPSAFTASINRLSGPAVITATDTVAASYWASVSVSSSATTPINFDSKEYDLTSSVTTGTPWKFTALVTGTYSVTGSLSNSSGSGLVLYIYKNGGQYKQIAVINAAGTATWSSSVRLLAGDYIDFRPSGAMTSSGGTLITSPTNVSIFRIGN